MSTIIVTPAGLRAAAAAVERSSADVEHAQQVLAQQLTVAVEMPGSNAIEGCGATSLQACELLADAHRRLARALTIIADGQEKLENSIASATGAPGAPRS